jgi:hypothetical protein
MDKSVLVKALNHARALNADEGRRLSEAEAGVLQEFMRTGPRQKTGLSDSKKELLDHVEKLLLVWLEQPAAKEEDAASTPEKDAGRLREALRKFQQKEYALLTENDLHLVQLRRQELRRRNDPDEKAKKLLSLLNTLLHDWEEAGSPAPLTEEEAAAKKQEAEARAEVPPQAPEPGIVKIVNQLDADTLFTDENRFIDADGSVLEEENIQVYTVEGSTELEGDIPDDTMLIVKEGDLIVHGAVSGNLVVARDITVNGDVVSMAGNDPGELQIVEQNPACLFAWGELAVHGDVSGGKLLGRNIIVDGTVTGAELHAVGAIRAAAFRASEYEQTIICLREMISGNDFGMPARTGREQRRPIVLPRKRNDHIGLDPLIAYALEEINDTMRTMIYHLMGVLPGSQQIRLLRGLQCQINALKTIAGAAEKLRKTLADFRKHHHDADEHEMEFNARQCLEIFAPVESELDTLSGAYELNARNTINLFMKDFSRLLHDLGKRALPVSESSRALEETAAHISRWKTLAQELERELSRLIAGFGLAPSAINLVENEPDKLAHLLNQLHEKAAQDTGSILWKRSKSSAMRLLQATRDRNRKKIDHWRSQMKAGGHILQSVKRSLGEDYQYLFRDPAADPAAVTASHYDPKVILAANPASNTPPLRTAGSIFVLNENIDEPATFILKDGSIIRLPS